MTIRLRLFRTFNYFWNQPCTGIHQQYVNDRPYVASSLMSAAIAKSFGTALGGRCQLKPELVHVFGVLALESEPVDPRL